MKENEMNASRCPECGSEKPAGSASGLCPRCAAKFLQGEPSEWPGDTGAPRGPAGQPRAFKAPPAVAELADKFPQLEIIELLGRGGMGVVYKARQKALNRVVALKLLAPERVEDARFAGRFAREAQALAALSHPNIVTVHDFGQAGGYYFLLMEFVDGVNLRQALQGGRFTPEQALAVVPPICDALQYAHDRGIVHRDIKPENLLLDKSGKVKIADFGIAKMLGAEVAAGPGAEGMQATAAGTPQYMAPEQRQNPARADHRADIYSLGVVLYEMLTGELPGARLQKPSQKVEIDVRLDEVVLRALENEPGRRYATAGEFKTSLQTVTARERGPAPEPKEKENPRMAYLALALLLAGILGPLALMAVSRRDEISLLFGAGALLLALIFGLMTWRMRMGRAVAITILTMLAAGVLFGVVSVGIYFLRGRTILAEVMRQEQKKQELTRVADETRKKLAEAQAQILTNHAPGNITNAVSVGGGSKRERFEPREGMALETSWSVHPKPSFLNRNGWAVMARMSLGGVARIQLPGEEQRRCDITLLKGDDEGITVKIDDLARNSSMTLSLRRDHPGEITVDGAGYRVLFPTTHVGPADPDISRFAHVIVTPIEAGESSGKSKN